MNDEILEIVDREGRVTGTARRSDLHRNPALIHRVVHVLVFHPDGRLLLQRRSLAKDTAPGKWDTSVGGHVQPGEVLEEAARREMAEELGIAGPALQYLHTYLYTNAVESELVTTYACRYDGEIRFDPDEITGTAFWKMGDIASALGSGVFSGHFEAEFRRYAGRPA